MGRASNPRHMVTSGDAHLEAEWGKGSNEHGPRC